MTQNYTYIAISESNTECELCGRTGLKKTIVVRNNETGEFNFFGTECANNALSFGIKEINKESKKADKLYQSEAHNHCFRLIKSIDDEYRSSVENGKYTFINAPWDEINKRKAECVNKTSEIFPFWKLEYMNLNVR